MRLLARVVEWQTRGTQNPVPATACGFNSHLGHSLIVTWTMSHPIRRLALAALPALAGTAAGLLHRGAGGMSLRQVSGGFLHTCGLTAAGSLYCWGDNSLGQLGTGGSSSSLVPVPVPVD